MTEQDLISQLKKLKAVKPDKDWLMAARGEVLSKAPVFDGAVKIKNLGGFNISAVRAGRRDADLSRLGVRNSYNQDAVNENAAVNRVSSIGDLNKGRSSGILGFRFLFKLKQFKPAMASLAIAAIVIGGGSILTARAAQTSLPGDLLYGVKRMMEGTQITIASDKNKPALETEFVGRRLEEMVKISEKTSDVEQQEKIKKLAQEAEEGMKRTESHLAALDGSPKEAAKAAKTVSAQTEKYADVLVKAKEKMPEPVKEEVKDVIVKAADTAEKVNFKALGVLADADKSDLEEAGISEEEIKDKIKVIIDKKVEATKVESAKVEDAKAENTGDGLLKEEDKNVKNVKDVEEAESGIQNPESGDGKSVNAGENSVEENVGKEVKTETEKTEKTEIDCSECGDKDGEKICSKETDEEGNTKCYFEQAVPTQVVPTVKDKLSEAQDKLEEGDLKAAVENLKAADEMESDGDADGEVKGAVDESGNLKEGGEKDKEIGN